MEWTASQDRVRRRQRPQSSSVINRRQQSASTPSAEVKGLQAPETSTLVSIYRCDSELRVSEVIYSDHVGDATHFIGCTDYDVLPSEEADVVMGMKRRARDEQRPVRDTVTLTWEGSPHSF